MKFLYIVFFFIIASALLVPQFAYALANEWGDDDGDATTGDCPADAEFGILKNYAVGCKCNYKRGGVTVRCPSDKYVCTTNSFNSSGVNVCLLRLGQQCNTVATETALPVTNDAICEGGAICDTNSQTCKVDTGDTTLSGALGSTTSDLRDTVRRFINIGLGFLGVLTVLMVIYGGYMWLTAAGAEDKVTKGKNILIWAIIGTIVISIAWTISSYVLQVGRTAG